MATLSELTVQVLTARLAKRDMSLEELQKEMTAISTQLKAIEEGTNQEPVTDPQVEEPKKAINYKQYFKKDEVICILCNKSFTTLKKHLTQAHQLTHKEYKVQFGIPSKQPLVAKAYSDKKKADALKNNLGAKMQAGKKAKAEVVAVVPVQEKVSVGTKKAGVPVKVEAVKVPVKATKKAAVPAKVAKKK